MRYEQNVQRAADRISAALDDLVKTLPKDLALHMAIARLDGKPAKAQPQRMQWIMEDPFVSL